MPVAICRSTNPREKMSAEARACMNFMFEFLRPFFTTVDIFFKFITLGLCMLYLALFSKNELKSGGKCSILLGTLYSFSSSICERYSKPMKHIFSIDLCLLSSNMMMFSCLRLPCIAPKSLIVSRRELIWDIKKPKLALPTSWPISS